MQTPDQIKAEIEHRGWQTIAGFQTRNVPHLAHEYLIRLALEQCDGVLIQPAVGRKLPGEYTSEAILTGWQVLIVNYLPADRIILDPLDVPSFYAGPDEAVVHAAIRRMYGCTHFVIGRDQCGSGDRWGDCDAQDAVRDANLGLQLICNPGPYWCSRCGTVVSARTCSHQDAGKPISGTQVRDALRAKCIPEFVRPEVVSALFQLPKLFVEDTQ